MASVCFYFQLHQPIRLKEYSFFKIGVDHAYEATDQNVAILNRVSDVSYLPANKLMLKLIDISDGKFRITYSISGILLEQLEKYRPDVIASFQKLYKTGAVEFLCETYYHSLASLFSPTEFNAQVEKQEAILNRLFGAKPKAFRNTELIYSDQIAAQAFNLGYKTILTEGKLNHLTENNPNEFYKNQNSGQVVMLRDFTFSDDIAFRFADKTWNQFPLLAPKFASWIHAKKEAKYILIGIDYETFGEHRSVETGIFQFMTYLPGEIFSQKGWEFKTVSEASAKTKPVFDFKAPNPISWADDVKDTTAWTHDYMQQEALSKIFALEEKVLNSENSAILSTWRKLQTSDHFYYMSTRFWHDPTHLAFNPYRNPYDAYINYMNVLSDFEKVIG